MKKISKTRRIYLNKFLENPNGGYTSAQYLWRGILPHSPSNKQGYEYWYERYYHVYYKGKSPYGSMKMTPMSKEDMDYIRSLVNIDPFLSDEENKEYIV